MVGSDVVLRVTDPDMNYDSDLVEEFNVTIWSDNDDRKIAYTVTETGKDTGVFDANVFFTTTDSSPGKRLRIVDGSTVFAKYTDYTFSESYKAIDVINSVVTSGLSILERHADGSVSQITYDPCALMLFAQNHDQFEQMDVFYPPPLKQISSGLSGDEVRCKESFSLMTKYDGSPACVTESTRQKLIERGWIDDVSKTLWNDAHDWNSMGLVRNDDGLYCNSNEELSDQCYFLEQIVFGNARKNWKVLPGAGIILPDNSKLTPIYKTSTLGLSQIDLNAMLDDKIFVNKCESNGGVWNYTRHDCEVLWNVCNDIGGIIIQEDVTPPCTDTGIIDDDPLTIKVCRGAGIIRASCVFEYEN
jgi:hypothetical protein